jgi:hypothetical protein
VPERATALFDVKGLVFDLLAVSRRDRLRTASIRHSVRRCPFLHRLRQRQRCLPVQHRKPLAVHLVEGEKRSRADLCDPPRESVLLWMPTVPPADNKSSMRSARPAT